MKANAVIKILKSITWRHSTHHSKDGRRPEAEQAVKDRYSDKNLDALGIEKAEVKYVSFGVTVLLCYILNNFPLALKLICFTQVNLPRRRWA